MLYRARRVMVNRGVASGQVPHPQAWIKRELIVSRKISVASSPLVKDQMLFAPVRAAGRHGLVCQTVLDRLCRCRDRWIRHVCVVVEQNLMFVHVVDVNLPRHRPNVPLKGNWHFLSPYLKIVHPPPRRSSLSRWPGEPLKAAFQSRRNRHDDAR